VAIPAYFQTMLDQAGGFSSADLVFYSHTGDYWLHLVVTLPEPVVSCSAAAQVIGVDVGISRIAVSSDNCFFTGKRVKEHVRRMFRLRRALQAAHALARSTCTGRTLVMAPSAMEHMCASEGSRSAKRHLRRLRQRENRFRADVNHCVSKRLVETLPPGSVIVMENLTNIRERVRARCAQRREMHNWSFGQLRAFVAYKAAARGIQVEFADRRYSSQACSGCGHIARSNRKTQRWFSCVKCGYQSNADLNAARNLALRARGAQSGLSVNQPIVSSVDAKAPSLANCG
jgi:IS605 OrfB family transposase